MDISDRNRNVVGIYPTAAGAQKAINDLLDLGYRTDEISVISRAIDDDRKNIEDMETLHDPSWSHGARPGGAVGGVSGLLAGLGQLEVPGMGTVMAGGPIKDYLTSRQVGGKPVGTPEATIGQVICGPDAPAGDAAFVEERFQAGDIFIRVDAAGDRLARVAEVFGQHRAHGSDPYERP